MPTIDTVTRTLPCELTQDELIDRGGRLAAVQQDIDTETSAQVEQKQAMKARMTALEADRARLAGIVARRREPREVRVQLQHDYALGVFIEVREDTGEQIFSRPLSDSERQMTLSEL